MAGDNHGAEAQEEPQAQEDLGQQQATQAPLSSPLHLATSHAHAV